MNNSYGYSVFACGKIPLHIVEVKTSIFCGFFVFNNAKDARSFILREKEKLSLYNIDMLYNADFPFNKTLLEIYTRRNAGMFTDLSSKQIYKNAI